MTNLCCYVYHDNGQVEYHNFRENLITGILASNPKKKHIQGLLSYAGSEVTYLEDDQKETRVELFPNSIQEEGTYLVEKSQSKYSSVIYYHKKRDREVKISKELLELVIETALISSDEEETSEAIRKYSINLLEVMNIIVTQSKINTIN